MSVMSASDKGFLNAGIDRQLLLIYKAMLAVAGGGGGGGGGGTINTVYTPTTLKALVTVGVNDEAFFVDETGGLGGLHVWRLQSGATAEDLPGGILRPDDYTAVTNEKIYTREI